MVDYDSAIKHVYEEILSHGKMFPRFCEVINGGVELYIIILYQLYEWV